MNIENFKSNVKFHSNKRKTKRFNFNGKKKESKTKNKRNNMKIMTSTIKEPKWNQDFQELLIWIFDSPHD